MTLEERVERLENFTGDIDKIVSVYANSIQQICDKYLNLLYIEAPHTGSDNVLLLDGFLSEITTIEALPKNVMFNVRPSHNFAYQGSTTASKLKLKRGSSYIEIPLKKYDVENPGNLKFLEPNDYMRGLLYGIYIDSQGIAIISSNDSAAVALQEVTQLSTAVDELTKRIDAMTSAQTVSDLDATIANIATLTVSQALNITNPVQLPTGSMCSTPNGNTHIANKGYVDSAIATAISNYHNTFHIFGNGDPSTALTSAPEKAIYYKY